MTVAMTVTIVVDRPVAINPGFYRNIVVVPAAPAATMSIVSSRAMAHSAVIMLVMAIIIEDGAYNDTSNEASN